MKDLSKVVEREGINGEILSILGYHDFVEMGAINTSYKKKIFDFKLSALKESGYTPIIIQGNNLCKFGYSEFEESSSKRMICKKYYHSKAISNVSELKIP